MTRSAATLVSFAAVRFLGGCHTTLPQRCVTSPKKAAGKETTATQATLYFAITPLKRFHGNVQYRNHKSIAYLAMGTTVKAIKYRDKVKPNLLHLIHQFIEVSDSD